jgi:N-acetylneuraminate synthase
VLEKHFTTDKNAVGPDHMLSADPHEMKFLVEQVRQLEKILGNGIKMPAESERTTRVNNRKSIVAKRKLEAGHKITMQDVAIKRPGYGIAPKYFDQVIGRTTIRSLGEDKVINWDDLS